jgi:hypothetical protein
VKEESKVLVIATSDEPERRARLDEIAASYKAKFEQESVAMILTPSCVVF